VIGSTQQSLSFALAPQQELPPFVTRNAACPYFSLTTSLISIVELPPLLLVSDKIGAPLPCGRGETRIIKIPLEAPDRSRKARERSRFVPIA
jgi:hypothetical protein